MCVNILKWKSGLTLWYTHSYNNINVLWGEGNEIPMWISVFIVNTFYRGIHDKNTHVAISTQLCS
uniref:Uncharacterized protein n=1 Tax=Anguilla anguilla TaxID=7936 RepID=A0A0E9XA61_ANGAN